jgi:hypothetical protein
MNTGPVDTVIHIGFQVGNSVRFSMLPVPYVPYVMQENITSMVNFRSDFCINKIYLKSSVTVLEDTLLFKLPDSVNVCR